MHIAHRVLGAVVMIVSSAFRSAGQSPLREDDRAYSSAQADRGYIAARCAALYSEMAQAMAGSQDSMASAKAREATRFLKRVPRPPERTFLEWSAEYKARFERNEPPTQLWGQDYEACQALLLVIQDGDRMTNYTREELAYLMGAKAKGRPE